MKKESKIKNSVKSSTVSVREECGVSDLKHDVSKIRTRKVTRAYHLPCYPNRDKFDTARYLIDRFNLYTQYCVSRSFFNSPIKSTKGCGELFNRANHKARDIVKKQKASHNETMNKMNIPKISKERPLVKFEKAKSVRFDYIVKVSNQFEKCKTVKIPVKSTKVLNKALKNNWKFTSFGEISVKKDKMYLTVFVQKEVEIPNPNPKCTGVDVGINKSVTSSEGHYGESLKSTMKRFKESQRERYRQRMKFGQTQRLRKNSKTRIKQILDKEAKTIVGRSKSSGSSLVVESRKILKNLRTGKLNFWARNYFANRCEILCKENGVFFLEVDPWNSSKTCSNCREKGDRNKEEFVCKNTSCEMHKKSVDADFNAAKVISHRGRSVILDKIIPKLRSGGRKGALHAA